MIAAPERTAEVFADALPVMPVGATPRAAPGKPDATDAKLVLRAIEIAVAEVQSGRAAALVTNPINKDALYRAGFHHPGHTEYLAELAGSEEPAVMMLASAELRVVPVTIHLALRDAIAALTTQGIVHAGRVVDAALRRDFGIAAPVLAVAGLNPHAGENGGLGHEDIDIVAPAVAQLRAAGIDARGPLAADTMFHAAARAVYDAALCMYHDQALIPIKTLDFDGAVNVTLGLPFIRTSPDHGTAFDIAGKGVARPDSLIAALRLAASMAARRATKLSQQPSTVLPPLREVIARHGIAARKSLGQNFILDLNLTRRIARAAGPLDSGTTIEIGPGPGGLTRALLDEGAARVVAIERDPRCLAALAELQAHYARRLELIEGDALVLDPAALTPAPRRIVANLPYNIATALLLRWLDRITDYESLTLMFQREVAERLTAAPRSAAYGRLSVLVQWLCEARILFDIPPRAFTPPPKVTSSVVRLVPRAAPLALADKATLERVTAAAFGQRRKMLRSSLKSLGVAVEPLLSEAGLAGTARAEELSVAEFCALARATEKSARSDGRSGR